MKKETKHMIKALVIITIGIILVFIALKIIQGVIQFLVNGFLKLAFLALLIYGIYWIIKNGKAKPYINKILKM